MKITVNFEEKEMEAVKVLARVFGNKDEIRKTVSVDKKAYSMNRADNLLFISVVPEFVVDACEYVGELYSKIKTVCEMIKPIFKSLEKSANERFAKWREEPEHLYLHKGTEYTTEAEYRNALKVDSFIYEAEVVDCGNEKRTHLYRESDLDRAMSEMIAGEVTNFKRI